MMERAGRLGLAMGLAWVLGAGTSARAQAPVLPMTASPDGVTVTGPSGTSAFIPQRDTAAAIAWRTYHRSGWEALRARKLDLAESLFRAGLKEAERLGPSDSRYATSYNDLGWLFLMRDRPADAEPLARWAIQTRESRLGPVHPEVGDSLLLLSRIAVGQSKFDDAETYARRAVAIFFKSNFGIEDRYPPYALDTLGEVLEARGDHTQAEAIYLRALNLRESALGINLESPYISEKDVASSYVRLGDLLRKMGRDAEADALEEKARETTGLGDLAPAGPEPGEGQEPPAAPAAPPGNF